ncbi:MAG: serine hydrolase [Actinomycetaceae bacterium]|nr:serine hydrolase [Actinomycetaceae bacterium]
MSGAAQSGSQSSVTSRELTAENVNTWLDGYMPAALESRKIAGATVAVVKDGKVLTTRGFGYADTGNGGEGKPVPVDPDKHLFRVGSISKIPTSIAVMQLVEQGKVELDADISTYVDAPIKRRFDTPITVRHLLTHTAGFEEHLFNAATGPESYDLEKGVMLDPPEQVYEPGTTPAYSNYGMDMLGLIVQKVSGQRFEDYVQANIFDPLEMESSTYEQPMPENLASRMSKGYMDSSQDPSPFEVAPQPAGSLTTSAPDFAKFMIAHTNRDPRILKPETWEQMWNAAPNEKLGGMQQGERVGLGYMLSQRNGHRIAGHGGDTTLFHSWYDIYPEQGIGLFISVNSTGTGTHDIREEIAKRFADQYLPDTTSLSGLGSEERIQHAQQIAGIYDSSRSWHSTFFVQANGPQAAHIGAKSNGNIVLSIGGKSVEYEEIQPYLWREIGGDRHISADLSAGYPRLNQMGIMTYIPQSSANTAMAVLSTASYVLLGIVLVLWVVGGLRSAIARHYGVALPVPLNWQGRVGRIGAILAVPMPTVWTLLASAIAPTVFTTRMPDWWIRGVQGLQLLAVLALIPAVWDVVRAVREKRGWPRVLVAVALVLGLLAMACWAVLGNALNPDISY